MTGRGLKRCRRCGCYAKGLAKNGSGCERGEDLVEGQSMCQAMHITLLEHALRRALVPDAFDERARIKPGRLFDALDAENAALRQAASLLGPIPADAEFSRTPQAQEPRS